MTDKLYYLYFDSFVLPSVFKKIVGYILQFTYVITGNAV